MMLVILVRGETPAAVFRKKKYLCGRLFAIILVQ